VRLAIAALLQVLVTAMVLRPVVANTALSVGRPAGHDPGTARHRADSRGPRGRARHRQEHGTASSASRFAVERLARLAGFAGIPLRYFAVARSTLSLSICL